MAAMGSRVLERGQQSIRHYGAYANASRGKQRKRETEEPIPTVVEPDLCSREVKRNYLTILYDVYPDRTARAFPSWLLSKQHSCYKVIHMPFDDGGFKPHPLRWVVEPLTGQPSYLEKSLFGCRACYLHGRLVLVLASRGDEPWQGLPVPTDKANHESLLEEFPELVIHPVSGKWLYLPEEIEDFEEAASRLVGRIALDDPRLGVVPQPRKRPGRKGGPGRVARTRNP